MFFPFFTCCPVPPNSKKENGSRIEYRTCRRMTSFQKQIPRKSKNLWTTLIAWSEKTFIQNNLISTDDNDLFDSWIALLDRGGFIEKYNSKGGEIHMKNNGDHLAYRTVAVGEERRGGATVIPSSGRCRGKAPSIG